MLKQTSRLALIALTALAVCDAAAQAYPARPIRFIVPQTPGGASDALARITGQKLGDQWNQQIVIDNRGGAGGNIGTDTVAKSAPDGYTWLLAYVGTHAINAALYKKLPFNPDKDFAPVATLATLPFVVIVVQVPFVAAGRSWPPSMTQREQSNRRVAFASFP